MPVQTKSTAAAATNFARIRAFIRNASWLIWL
jgi:hypothetical protein